ncbi:MAG: hypothetical protein U1E15_09385 [Hyphomicrobiales bacterium]
MSLSKSMRLKRTPGKMMILAGDVTAAACGLSARLRGSNSTTDDGDIQRLFFPSLAPVVTIAASHG